MNTTSSNTISIYDVVSHRSFYINANDVNVTRTKKENADKLWMHCYVHVHESAKTKTPCKLGYFITSNKTLEKIIRKPRKQW